MLAPLFPKGYSVPRTIFSSGPYADIVPVLDQVFAGWLTARRDLDAAELAGLL